MFPPKDLLSGLRATKREKKDGLQHDKTCWAANGFLPLLIMKKATICVEASAAHVAVGPRGILRSTMGLRVAWGHDQREYQAEVEVKAWTLK